ncbi:MAG: nucleoside-diphosphate sugar epimerase/dehydratase [Bacteroidota bacterium]
MSYWVKTMVAILDTSRNNKRLLMMLFDAVSVLISITLSKYLISGGEAFFNQSMLLFSITLVFCSLIVFKVMGFYDLVIRYMGQKGNILITKGVFLTALLFVGIGYVLKIEILFISVLIYFLVDLLCIAGSRFFVRAYYYQFIKNKKKHVAIYGAGVSGLQLLSSLYHGEEYEPVVFIDDDVNKHNTVVHGVKVFPPIQLEALINKFDIDSILIAMPSISRDERNKVIAFLEKFPVQIKTIPNASELISGTKTIENIQEVDIADLLGRAPIEPNENLLGACIHNKVVMVTGAGGSIGSELCRQVVNQSPKILILVESSEFALYSIHMELVNNDLEIDVIPLLCSVRDKKRLTTISKKYVVETIYHAAAFKHVPMVEHNIIEGVYNNIFGTLVLAQVAIESSVSTMVLISTDKAVRPTNVMGATKRFAELVLQALSCQDDSTNFCMVRFGNVLGSSGSVVPLFKEQIKYGGPLTVTHPDIVRFFMTISEAVQLVIQAGSMATGGDVFVLDMGDPVKIDDLAKRLIKLSGHGIKGDDCNNGIEVVYTGLRPGEKLYEELLIGDEENLTTTGHPRIMRAKEEAYVWSELKDLLDKIEAACDQDDYIGLVELLKNNKTNYVPERDICDYLY